MNPSWLINRKSNNMDSNHRQGGEETEGSPGHPHVFRADSKLYCQIPCLAVLSPSHDAGYIPEELGQLTALGWLNLSNNRLTGERLGRFFARLLDDGRKVAWKRFYIVVNGIVLPSATCCTV